MASRPRVEGHDGFLVPNATDVNPRMAEPDQIDFNTVAHAQWGVIEGCLVTVSGTTAVVQEGIAVVNGVLAVVQRAEISVGTGSSQDRFDMIVVDSGGTVKHITGDQSLDPVFKDVPKESTLLAAIFVPAGAPDLSANVIDKRKFVPKNLLTKIKEADDLIRNVNGDGDLWRVDGSGSMIWSGDAFLWRSGKEKISIRRYLAVSDGIEAGGTVTAGTLVSLGTVTGKNLNYGPTMPTVSTTPVGGLWTDSINGGVWVRTPSGWQEIATVRSAVPVGTIITSLQPPDYMRPLGWIPMAGQTVQERDRPNLFSIPALEDYITVNVDGSRSMELPNLTHRVLIDKPTAGWFGPAGRTAVNQITMLARQMPTHNHNVRTQDSSGGKITADTAPAGYHTHVVGEMGSRHTHSVKDPGHRHQGMDLDGTGAHATAVIGKVFGGQNKLDALFNDSNHTHSVEPVAWTMPAYTDIEVGEANSTHTHHLSGDGSHRHDVTISASELIHQHPVLEDDRGQGDPIDITPSFFAVHTYIRS